ncbi:DNA repair protein RAD51 homolog A [Lactuca sativa]|uniref:Rad51-like C-terminal domain-containing protein n=1 Tax=Lactuca sativa TaxID=4236 RepID=A0A9R1WDW1_LACSA|nr:DNA repair protein RAD51 homolog A [Lactuca sativa]KAJ0224932.1 hypothetical protein LSAT_V11C100022610 [Lactuca sativa]
MLHVWVECNDVLENVEYARAHNTDHQSRVLLEAASMMVETRFALMIVDSATALYRTILVEVNNHPDASCKVLEEPSELHVVITNQVVAQVDGSSTFAGPQIKLICGNIMTHASTTRLALRKGRGKNEFAK